MASPYVQVSLPGGSDPLPTLLRCHLPGNHVSADVIGPVDDGDDETTRAAALCYEQLHLAASAGVLDLTDRAAVRQHLSGAPGAEMAQSIMAPYAQHARGLEHLAAEKANEAMVDNADAEKCGRALHGLPDELVHDATFSGLSRAQVRDLRSQNQLALTWQLSIGRRAAMKARPPRWVLILIAAVISGMESWLITMRLVDFSIFDVKSWIMLVAFGIALYLGTHYFSHGFGESIAEHNEIVDAAMDGTALGIGRRDHSPLVPGRARQSPSGAQFAGRSRSTDPVRARRRMLAWGWAVGGLATIYAVIAFMRVYQMATRLPGWLPGFPIMVAVLFAGVAVGVLALLTHWESQKSYLREDLDHAITLDDTTTARERQLRGDAQQLLFTAGEAERAAEQLLRDGHAARLRGLEQVHRAAQKVSSMAKLSEVVAPNPDYLGSYADTHAALTRERLEAAAIPQAAAEALLAGTVDFTPEVRVLSPWALRTADREAPPNLGFLDPYRKDPTTEGDSAPAATGPRRVLLIAVVVLLLVIALGVALLMATHSGVDSSALSARVLSLGWHHPESAAAGSLGASSR